MLFIRDHRQAPPRSGAFARAAGAMWLAGLGLALAMAAGCDPAQEPAGSAAAEAEPVAGQSAPPEGDARGLADDGAKASYSLGYRFAENVQRQFSEDIENEAFIRGVQDKLDGKPAEVNEAEAQRVLTGLMETRQARADNQALENLEEGLAFLEKNAEREGVVALESGLQYEVLEEGEGEKPVASDTVTTHYEGRLIDGTVFDSSYQRGQPASFPLNQVIAGWTEGLQLMSPGAKYRLYVPAELAYGDRGAGSIPPNSTLIFDVELLEIASAGQGSDAADPAAGEQQDDSGQ